MPDDVKLFLDSAMLFDVETANSTGKLAGITINPTLALKAIGEKGDYAAHVKKLYDIVGPGCHKSYQVIGKTSEEMIRAAIRLKEAFDDYGGFAAKVPVLAAGPEEAHIARESLSAIEYLSKNGVLVNVTTIQDARQMALAAYAASGAEVILSPFLGRTDDYIRSEKMRVEYSKEDYFPAIGEHPYSDGFGNVSGVHMMSRGVYSLRLMRIMGIKHEAKVLAASIRNAAQAREAYVNGADIITSPFDIFMTIADSSFEWPDRQKAYDYRIVEELHEVAVRRWINTYANGRDEEIFSLLYHPKTVEGAEKFLLDGERLASFKNLM